MSLVQCSNDGAGVATWAVQRQRKTEIQGTTKRQQNPCLNSS